MLRVALLVAARVDAFPDTDCEGRITAIEPKVDENPCNGNVQAFANSHGRLQPGLFALFAVPAASLCLGRDYATQRSREREVPAAVPTSGEAGA